VRNHEPEAGHALAETAVILAAVAVICLIAVVFLGFAIRERLDGSNVNPVGPFTPPATTPKPAYPTTLEDCEHGGWRNFARFRNERECKEFVRSLRQ
jgi:hypothetical protein